MIYIFAIIGAFVAFRTPSIVHTHTHGDALAYMITKKHNAFEFV